jgi:hypothetical protein
MRIATLFRRSPDPTPVLGSALAAYRRTHQAHPMTPGMDPAFDSAMENDIDLPAIEARLDKLFTPHAAAPAIGAGGPDDNQEGGAIVT